jgi:hypothetical protein
LKQDFSRVVETKVDSYLITTFNDGLVFFHSKTIIENIKNAKDFEEKITYLKAIGNAGWITEDLFKVVCGILQDVTAPIHVRLQAIWALRHMARVRPLLVSRIYE